MLAIGSRLHSQFTGWGVDDALKIIRIEIDAEEMVRHRARQTRPCSATRLRSRAALLDRVARHNRKRPGCQEQVAGIKQATRAEIAKLQPQIAYLEAIRAELPEDGLFVDEFTQVGYVSRLGFPGVQAAHLPDARAIRARSAWAIRPRSAPRWRAPTCRSCR